MERPSCFLGARRMVATIGSVQPRMAKPLPGCAVLEMATLCSQVSEAVSVRTTDSALSVRFLLSKSDLQ